MILMVTDHIHIMTHPTVMTLGDPDDHHPKAA
jgi:hypothetical protein